MSYSPNSQLTHCIQLKLLIRYALLAWIGEILRKEPEVRSILVALTVTLVCMFCLRNFLIFFYYYSSSFFIVVTKYDEQALLILF